MSNATQSSQLGNVITSPATRRAVYATFIVASVVAGAITVGIASVGDLPQWVTVMNTVLLFLGVPVGGLAAANTSKPVADTPAEVPGIGEPEL